MQIQHICSKTNLLGHSGITLQGCLEPSLAHQKSGRIRFTPSSPIALIRNQWERLPRFFTTFFALDTRTSRAKWSKFFTNWRWESLGQPWITSPVDGLTRTHKISQATRSRGDHLGTNMEADGLAPKGKTRVIPFSSTNRGWTPLHFR